MKIFQIVNGVCHWDATNEYPTLDSTVGKFDPDVVFVEAPDYVTEGWRYENGRFIHPDGKQPFLDLQGLDQVIEIMQKSYTSGVIFSKKIPDSWVDNSITLNDDRFLASNKYVYFVDADENDRAVYNRNNVFPLDITVDGEMQFKADKAPGGEISIRILRLLVKSDE